MKKKIFKHDNRTNEYPHIGTMKSIVPDWWKESERFLGGAPQFLPEINKGLKLCVPFLDSLTSGYYIPLSKDIIVKQADDGIPQLSWGPGGELPPVRERKAPKMPTPAGYSIDNFAWQIEPSYQLPPGYSLLFTSPMNRFDLPFITASAIIDADVPMFPGNAPFFLKDGFEGVIPQGTPVAQVIPFKRESWKLEHTVGLSQEAEKNRTRSNAKIFGWYKNNVWHKKSYD